MMPPISRAIATAVLGALAGAACLVIAFAWRPGVSLEMDRELPPFASGFHPPERNGDQTFVWTSERASLSLPGLDRRVSWVCSVRFRGARAPGLPQPDLLAGVDGVRVGAWPGTNEFKDVEVTVPAAPAKPGLVLTLESTTTFVPGRQDPRRLGVQVERLSCRPAEGIVLPPRRALGAAAVAAALLGAGFALAGVTAGSAVGAAALMAAGQAWVAVSWGALFGPFMDLVVRLAFWMAFAMAVASGLAALLRKEPLRHTAKFVVTFTAGTLYLQLLALLHPSKPVVDALFHAHRFDWVLAGRLYFTQLSTSATPFPYAVGLYLFAAPWALLTTNHVALLRIVVSSSTIAAGALLYPMVVRTWGNRLAAAMAVALFSLVPLPYGIIGNANLTSAFGQAVSVAAVAVVMLSADRLRRAWPFVGAVLLVTLGMICHVSTVLLLTATLVCLAGLFYWLGAESLRSSARAILLVTAVSVAASTVIYWGHFGSVYGAQIERLPAPAAAASAADPNAVPALGRTTLPLAVRAEQALAQTVENLGWPLLALALIGAWRTFLEGARDRAGLVVCAWGLVAAAFIGASVAWPGARTYQQDASEFIGRVEHATMPAAVLLAARGAAWGWQGGRAIRIASVLLLAAAVAVGIRAWAAWLV